MLLLMSTRLRFRAPSLLLGVALLSASGAGSAQNTARCPEPTFSLSTRTPHPSFDRSLGLAGIGALWAERGAGPGPAPGWIVGGIYLSELRASYQMLWNPTHSGGSCLGGLSLALALSSKINVARELPQGSCSEKAVLEHEMLHHRIQVSRQADGVASFLARNPLPREPFNGMAARDAWLRGYSDSLLGSVRRFVDPAQDAIDTPEEYARLSNACPSEFNHAHLPPR